MGKDTVLQKMRDMGLPLHYAVTATTRPRRPGEIDGFHYYFLSPEQFERKLAENSFLEHAKVYQHWYGSPREPVEEHLRRGQDVILKVDVQGARSVRQAMPEAVLIFLAPPSLTWLREHLRERKTDTGDRLRAREEAAIAELQAADEFDHIVVNRDNDVEAVVEEIAEIIAQERKNRSGARR